MVWPALVVAVEPGLDVRPRAVWISHATTLLRSALEHLRPDYDTPYDDDGLQTWEDVDAHLKELRRGTSRYDDLTQQNVPNDDGPDSDGYS